MISNPEIVGIVLAAGDSFRMGQPKAILKFRGKTFLEITLKLSEQAGCRKTYVVLGKDAGRIKTQVPEVKAEFLVNPLPHLGQLSSIKFALKNIPSGIKGVLIFLVDHPAVKSETGIQIFNAANERPDKIIIPVYENRRGHPVYFGHTFFRYLLDAPLDEGARYVVNQHPEDVHLLPVEDDGILLDIDTPDDYNSL